MATFQITKKLRIIPLIGIQSSTFAERYISGVCWRLFGWRTHGEIEAQGPLPEDYLIDDLKMCAKINRFDGGHDEALRADLGLFLGMLRGGVLTPAGTLRPDARTLVIIHTQDFCEGYERGRRDYFTRFEEIVHTEDELLDLFKARAQDNLYLDKEQDTLRWAVGCTVGELSGRVFPLTQQEQRYQDSTQQVKLLTVLQEA
jgi:hypothetical protein